MDFVSLSFALFLCIGVLVYYCIPRKGQWLWLLFLGVVFYVASSVKLGVFIAFSILSTFFYTRFFRNKIGLWITIALNAAILLALKFLSVGSIIPVRFGREGFSIALPLGISFYTMTVIAYCVDVYQKKIKPEGSLLKYALFVSFFPQILQGPIPRFDQLSDQFFKEHKFNFQKISYSLQYMLWGFFQKMVIADRAAIVVNRLFGEYETHKGFYVLIAGVLYSIQLYADFNGCVCIAKGAAGLFDIKIADNFSNPYFSSSIQDFWKRWHISLSTWLRDYVYIPLGGNRKGKTRKYFNILITFVVSGIWHGIGFHYIIWGLLHGLYQIIGEVLQPVRDKAVALFQVNRDSFSHRLFKQISTLFLVMVAWIVFRADSVSQAFIMIKNMLTVCNPWIFLDNSLNLLGIHEKEWPILLLGVFMMWVVGMLQKHISIRETLAKQSLLFRWGIIFIGIFSIIIFGIYGPGYDASQFIYGNF